MSTVLEGNSEANFVFATMIEFCHLWKSRKEASFSIDCKEGNASLNFKCSLGHPDEKHINPHQLGHPDQEHAMKKRIKQKKSPSKVSRNNARAAAFQALNNVTTPTRDQELERSTFVKEYKDGAPLPQDPSNSEILSVLIGALVKKDDDAMNAFTEAANIQSKLFTEAAGSSTPTTIPKVKMQTIFANPDENNADFDDGENLEDEKKYDKWGNVVENEMESETAHYEVPETESETTDEDGVQRVIETGCVPKIISYLARGNSENQREAACDISELISCSNKDQVTYFLAQGVIPPLCNLLNCDSEYRLLRSVLNILIDMLKVPGQDQYTLDDIAFALRRSRQDKKFTESFGGTQAG